MKKIYLIVIGVLLAQLFAFAQPEYTGARKVTIENGKMYVDGKPFYVNAAAATMAHTLMADYGANTCRIYGISNIKAGKAILDSLYAHGLMCYTGLPATQAANIKKGTPGYEDAEWRTAKVASVMKIVNAFKDHPAVLCWSMGNEVEGAGHPTDEGIYRYYGELCAAIKAVDPNHPVTMAFTDVPNPKKIKLVNEFCPDVDFICHNTYYSVLERHKANDRVPYTDLLAEYGWTKPYMITEYGPTGTWRRSELLEEGRINDWGALIQLSAEEAAQKYIECYHIIKGYENCLGSVAFWWGYQTHGQVLGWYPFFTKEMKVLPAAEAMESCWRGTEYNPKSPLVASWQNSITLNGRPVYKGKKNKKNPTVEPGQKCTAKIIASCRSGNPDSSLEYKWFLYKDSVYKHRGSDTEWVAVTWNDCESMYDPKGGHKAMNEDANAELFTDRTKSEVEFTAPTQTGGYRLYCIVTDPSNNRASSACLNFYVGEIEE